MEESNAMYNILKVEGERSFTKKVRRRVNALKTRVLGLAEVSGAHSYSTISMTEEFHQLCFGTYSTYPDMARKPAIDMAKSKH